MGKYFVLWVPNSKLSAESAPLRFDELVAGEALVGETIEVNASEAQTLQRSNKVAIIAPEMQIKLFDPLPATSTVEWGIAAIGADQCKWTGQGTRVAVLDTGISRDHAAFSGKRVYEKDFTGKGSGDQNGHGTHCAGTIFGDDVDGVRIGVARGVQDVFIAKVLDGQGKGTSAMLFEALLWALQNDVDIISLSLGFDFGGGVAERIKNGWPADIAASQELSAYRKNAEAIQAFMTLKKGYGVLSREPLVIAATGNESKRSVSPDFTVDAALPGAASDISVGAAGKRDKTLFVGDFSNTGPTVVGPGVSIKSAWPAGILKTLSGTSMATPHVAGVAALYFEALRDAGDKPTADIVRSYIISKSRADGFDPEYTNLDFGRGLIKVPD